MVLENALNEVKKWGARIGVCLLTAVAPMSGCGGEDECTKVGSFIGGVYKGEAFAEYDPQKMIPPEEKRSSVTFVVVPAYGTDEDFWLNAFEMHEYGRDNSGKFDESWDNPSRGVFEFHNYGEVTDDGKLEFRAYVDAMSGCCGRYELEYVIETERQTERPSEEELMSAKPVTLEDLCPACVPPEEYRP